MPEFMESLDNWSGYRPVSRTLSEAKVARFLDLMNNTDRLAPHLHEFLVKEVITTSDFPDLFGFTIERELLVRYRAAVPDWMNYVATGVMPNFNEGEMHKVQGNQNYMPRVVEKGEYLVQPVSDSHYHRRVYKRGMQFDISWESTVNDMLSAFDDVPVRFADAVVYTRAFNATSIYTAAAGPNPLLFGAAFVDVDGGVVANQGVLPLTIGNLEITLALMAAQTDIHGRPLGVRGMHLVVPQPLEYTARSILTSAQYTYAATAAAAIPLPTTNVVSQLGIQLHVDPLLQVIDLTGTNDTTWYLFADPAQGKAMQMDFLRGYEDPEICMKASDKVSTAGAPLSPFSGDFATDNIFYRVRDVHGGTQLDPRYAYAQVAP